MSSAKAASKCEALSFLSQQTVQIFVYKIYYCLLAVHLLILGVLLAQNSERLTGMTFAVQHDGLQPLADSGGVQQLLDRPLHSDRW